MCKNHLGETRYYKDKAIDKYSLLLLLGGGLLFQLMGLVKVSNLRGYAM